MSDERESLTGQPLGAVEAILEPVGSRSAALEPGPSDRNAPPATDDISDTPVKRRNYITRHWRGDLSLGVSFWVNYFLANVAKRSGSRSVMSLASRLEVSRIRNALLINIRLPRIATRPGLNEWYPQQLSRLDLQGHGEVGDDLQVGIAGALLLVDGPRVGAAARRHHYLVMTLPMRRLAQSSDNPALRKPSIMWAWSSGRSQ